MRKNLIKIVVILMCFTMMAVVNVSAALPITTNQEGVHDGYYYYFWTDGGGLVNMNLGPGGNYTVDWSNCGNFICGKGWNPGSDRAITYSASFNPGSNSFLTVYGFARNDTPSNYAVEYYVVENYGAWTPPGGTSSGTISSDGGIYNLYRAERNSPGITGLLQYWSVRTTKRSSGTVTLGNHFNAWASKGWIMGTRTFQIMATESYQSSGSANVTVSEGPTNPTPTPTATPTATLLPSATLLPTTGRGTPTPTVRGNYVVSYVVQSSWGTGGTVSCAIKNNTPVAVNGWTLVFNLPGGTTISNLWNGAYTQSDTTVTVKDSGYNRTIPANGGSVNFGFNYNGSSGVGSGFILNGTACAVQ